VQTDAAGTAGVAAVDDEEPQPARRNRPGARVTTVTARRREVRIDDNPFQNAPKVMLT
jgi:hypothetical protein